MVRIVFDENVDFGGARSDFLIPETDYRNIRSTADIGHPAVVAGGFMFVFCQLMSFGFVNRCAVLL